MCSWGSVGFSTLPPVPETMRNGFSVPCSVRIPSMKSPKKSPLAVSFTLQEIPFIKRESRLCVDESGYAFVQYSGEAQIQETFNADALTELLKLIPVMKYKYDEKGRRKHGIYDLPRIDSSGVIAYINRFGVVGISDINFREKVIQEQDFLSIVRLTGFNEQKTKKLYKGKALDPKFIDRLIAISVGNEVPYLLIENTLKDLARCARLFINLLEDANFREAGVLSLTDKNRKRIVSAWNNEGGAFKDEEDPANPKFNTNIEWTYTKGGEKKIPILDFAEGALSSFSLVLNKHLALITKAVVTTQGVRRFNLDNTGLETALSAYLVNAIQDKKVKRVCVVCGSVFLPMRVKEENLYCGERCSKKVRNKRLRAKKKVSAAKAGSKATPKARKEKSEQT